MLNCGHSLPGSGAVAVTLLLIGQMLRVPVQRRQRVREAELHELHKPGEASSFESSASLESERERWSVTFAASADRLCENMRFFFALHHYWKAKIEDVANVS